MDRVNTTFYRNEDDDNEHGTNFDPVEDNGWSCTHGGWTGYLGDDGLSMYSDEACKNLIVTYRKKVNHG